MKKEKKKQSSISGTSIAIILVAAIVIVGAYIVITKDSTTSKGVYTKVPNLEGDYTTQPVEIVELFDFMCPHCYETNKAQVMRQLKDKYGAKVRITYIPLHFIEDRNAPYETAILPVLAFEYAQANGKGEEMMTAIFNAFHEENLNITDISMLEGLAQGVGLPTDNFASRLGAYRGKVGAHDDRAFKFYFTVMDPIVPTVIVAGNLRIPTDPPLVTFDNLDKIVSSILSGTAPI